MWAAALNRMLARMARAHPAEVARLAAIAVSAQQHGNVYLGAAFGHRLAALDSSVALAPAARRRLSAPDVAPGVDGLEHDGGLSRNRQRRRQ